MEVSTLHTRHSLSLKANTQSIVFAITQISIPFLYLLILDLLLFKFLLNYPRNKVLVKFSVVSKLFLWDDPGVLFCDVLGVDNNPWFFTSYLVLLEVFTVLGVLVTCNTHIIED